MRQRLSSGRAGDDTRVEEEPGIRHSVRVGISGHALSPRSVRIVRSEIRRWLDQQTCNPDHLIGVSCLAPGADIVFAEEILSRGSRLKVILPSADYRNTAIHPDHAPAFDARAAGPRGLEAKRLLRSQRRRDLRASGHGRKRPMAGNLWRHLRRTSGPRWRLPRTSSPHGS